MVTVFFKTYGCQANVADSAGINTFLQGLGCTTVDAEHKADLIIINTCAIREKAEQKLYSYLGQILPLKQERSYLKVGIIGCVASYRKKDMLTRFDHVSFVSGARDDRGTFLTYLSNVVVQLQTAKQLFIDEGRVEKQSKGQDRDIKKVIRERGLRLPQAQDGKKAAMGGMCGGDTSGSDDIVTSPQEKKKTVKRSFVNITTGCNNYCTYCIVPFTRGREESFPLDDIVMRVEHDVQAGAKDITLVGQNVNSYTCPETGAGFAKLLEAVALIPGTFWVRYISPHPKDMTNDVLETMARYKDKLCGWCHFPLQAGSTRVLDLMNRTYTKEEYLNQISQIRRILPHATITTDIIVGFPGETHEEYLETLEVMEAVRFDLIYSFIYSPRKYTKAFKMGDPIASEEKSERLTRLQKRHKEICLERNSAYIGKKMRVLVEKRASSGRLLARSEGNHRIFFEGDDSLIGTFTQVLIVSAGPADLRGEHAQTT